MHASVVFFNALEMSTFYDLCGTDNPLIGLQLCYHTEFEALHRVSLRFK